ncbi:hypothetical protein HDU98_010017 [Podochytrium sp. JEL0797]|nr:hypothetical protein HDU98_010017 [Podochytrium sp. JEL0797]
METTSSAPPPEKDKATAKNRRELRTQNENAVRPTDEETRTLDGSLKKTSGFKAKLKTHLTAEHAPLLKKEVVLLKLDKYLDEIAAAIVDSKFAKPGDVWACVEVCSVLHQRYASFGGLIGAQVSKMFVGFEKALASAKDETLRVARLRVALRLLAEFVLVAAVPLSENTKALVATMRRLFNPTTDKDFANVQVAVPFCKTFQDVFFADNKLGEDSLVSDDTRIAIKQIMVDYFTAASKFLVRMHNYIKKAEVSNYEHAVARGEVSEERQERFQRALKTYEKLVTNCQSLALSLDQEMPDLPEPDSAANKLSIGISLAGSKEADDEEALAGGPWEDEESRSFYEDIIDLKDVVPSVLLGEKHEKPAAPTEAELEQLNSEILVADEPSSDTADESPKPEGDASMEDANPELDLEDDADEDEKAVPTTHSQQVLALFTALPNALSSEAIDKLAVEFCYVNTKGSRKRLIKALFEVPRQRLDILPYYARLIATLNPFIPEIATGVIALLERQFHFHQKKTDRTFVEEKIKVVRFMGELAKFKVPPLHMTYHFFKVMLENFTNHSIEAICSMLETCGRFLLKTPETSRPTGQVLDIIMKKKTALHLDTRLNLLIDNAFYQCNPPERTAIAQKVRPPLELYIRHLIYTDLSKKTSERVLKQLRKLNWHDPTTLAMVQKPFLKHWKIKSSNLHLLAFLAFELSRYYPDFGVLVVDACLEEIRVGLETNLFKFNSRRLASVRFLGEMYNYRLIDSGTVFDTLYYMLRFGYDNQFPEPNVSSPLDAPHDFFRVRLCCHLLETCGQCFDRGPLSLKLDEFLAFLQVYLHSKPRLSMDVEFLMIELFELVRPKAVLWKGYEEAVDAFNVLAVKHVALREEESGGVGAGMGVGQSEEEGEEEDGERGGREGDGGVGEEGVGEVEEGVVVQLPVDEVQEEEEEEEEEAAVVVHLPEQEVDAELEAEFDREFSKMMMDSLESRKGDKKMQAFDVAIPVKKGVVFQGAAGGGGEGAGKPGSEGVMFSFLTKKGNKQQMKSVELPQNSMFVLSTKQKKEAELEERKQLKKLVLGLDDRADDEDSALPMKPKAATINRRQFQHRPNVIPKSLFE